MVHAQKHTSLSSAKRGREALEAALKIDPENLKAREILYNFYTHAPWPIGSSAKAAAQLEEIRKRSPNRALAISLGPKISAKLFDEAFKVCDEMLAKNEEDTLALFQYGRVAAISGQNLERGIACLHKYIALAPKSSDAPSIANAWGRIGNIEQKRSHAEEARTAYKKALELEPNNKAAAAALASVK